MRHKTATTFDLAPPPRRLPFDLRLRVFFGGGLNQSGWLMLAIGLLVMAAAGFDSLRGLYQFRGSLDTSMGTIKYSWKTDHSEGGGGSRRNKRPGKPVYAYSYTFSDAAGVSREGVSYTTDTTFKPGNAVVIEYPSGEPAVSRIHGTRSSLHSAGTAIVVIFPLIGLLLLVLGWRGACRARRLLRDGLPALGTLVDKQATNMTVNKKRVYKLTFEFTTQDGETCRTAARTHETQNLEDEERERILYDPAQPSHARLWDKLPGSPRIDDTGNLTLKHPFFAALSLLLPLFVLLIVMSLCAAFWK